MSGFSGPGRPGNCFGRGNTTFSKASSPSLSPFLPGRFLSSLDSSLLSIPGPQSRLSRSQHPAYTLQLIPASERFSPASPWVITLLFSLVCLPVSMTASFPVGGAEHSLGQEPTNASKNQKSVLCQKKAAAALTLEKADFQGLTDVPALLHCNPPTSHWALRPAAVSKRPSSVRHSPGASRHSKLKR